MKKFLLFLLIALIAALLYWFSGILYPVFFQEALDLPQEIAIKTPEKITPGSVITLRLPLSIPANCKIADLSVNGSNIIPFPAERKFIRWAWNKTLWEITAPFRVLASGKNDSVNLSGNLDILFGKGKNSSFSIKVSPFEVIAPETTVANNAPQLSPDIIKPAAGIGEMFRKNTTLWIIGTVIVLAILLIFVWILLKKRSRNTSILTPWEMALGAIGAVVTSVRNREILPETGFIRLSDIIRNYLEIRFNMPLSKQTTAEFMRDFLRKKDYLPESQKPFLENFMNAADLIKFAKASSSTDALDEAALSAEKLINATAEITEGEKK